MALTKREVASLGGKLMALRQRDEAVRDYYEDPKLCLRCGSIIPVGAMKVSVVRKKQFCDRSCSASYRNTGVARYRGGGKPREAPLTRVCTGCGTTFEPPRKNGRLCYAVKLCPLCKDAGKLNIKTKGALFEKCSTWQSARSIIRAHACRVFFVSFPKACMACGYTLHVEVCHITPVSDFPPETLIEDINAISNLLGLCPTHHWEFDEGLLDIAHLQYR